VFAEPRSVFQGSCPDNQMPNSRNQKPPSRSAKLKLRQYRGQQDQERLPPARKKYTPEEVKRLFKNWI